MGETPRSQYYYECPDCGMEYMQPSAGPERCKYCGSSNVEPIEEPEFEGGAQ